MKNENTKKQGIKKEQIFFIIGILIGVLAIVFGIVICATDSYAGRVVDSSIKFGADYYTESYRAMAVAANNVRNLSEIAQIATNALGYLLIVAGLLIAFVFLKKLVCGKKCVHAAPQAEQTTECETDKSAE